MCRPGRIFAVVCLCLATLSLAAGAALAQADLSKLNPRARIALTQLRAGVPASRLAARAEAVTQAGELDVFVVGDVTRAELEGAGARVRTEAGDVFTAFLPADAVEAVAALPGVRSIEGAVPVAPLLNASVPATNVTKLRGQSRRFFPGLNGVNVLVGAVDSGVDYMHGDFDDPDGNTRLIDIWDQSDARGAPPAGFGYGSEWNSAAINANVPFEDMNGHGTHVLSIAGGDGSSSLVPGTYAGMAPWADLMMVCDLSGAPIDGGAPAGTSVATWSTRVVDGVEYIFNRATDAGRDAVVNISLGTQYGPHDGTSAFEMGLTNLTGPGRIVVVAAGNERGKHDHAQVFAAGLGTDVTLDIATPVGGNGRVGIDGYYGSKDKLAVMIIPPDPFATPVGPIELGGTSPGGFPGSRTLNGFVYVENKGTTSRGDHEVYIELAGDFAQLMTMDGRWTIRFIPMEGSAGTGRVDLWTFYSSGATTQFVAGDQPFQTMVTEPGNATGVITVAAYTTKNEFDGCTFINFPDAVAPGELCPFSSPGPTRDGRKKPDIAAPGSAIVAAASRGAYPWSCSSMYQLAYDQQYVAMEGTSMAAPHVTGAVALCLEAMPQATPAIIKQYLFKYAKPKALTSGSPRVVGWNQDWGNGRLWLDDLAVPAIYNWELNWRWRQLIPPASRVTLLGPDLLQDCFPSDPYLGYPPGPPPLDQMTAIVKTGLNAAPLTGGFARFDVPGDTALAIAGGDDIRMDLVFRIKPGPGNYVTPGWIASGLRKVPTSAAPVTPGDGTFWDVIRTIPGDFATPGATSLHLTWPGGWNPNVWNSARMDTAEINLFPVKGDWLLDANPTQGMWSATYHESDPRYSLLGMVRNRCFLMDTLGDAVSGNVDCSAVPPWLSALPASRTGWDGNQTTREFTKIIPDWLLTPGSHVEYFYRKSHASAPATILALGPDTSMAYPQAADASLDGHRWESFSVLPDRWKDSAYGGFGNACMLVIDWDDGGGDDRVWTGVADSIGATALSRRGARTGWSPVPGLDVNSPAGFFPAHLGQAGTAWDLYEVRGTNSLLFGSAGSPGSRLGAQPALGNPLFLKGSQQGPTPEMLNASYKLIFIFTGDCHADILGQFEDRSQDDVALLSDFLISSTPTSPHGLMVAGSGFAESGFAQWPEQAEFLGNTLGVSLNLPERSYSFFYDPDTVVDLRPNSPPELANAVFGIEDAHWIPWDNGWGGWMWANTIPSSEAFIASGAPGASTAAFLSLAQPGGPFAASVRVVPSAPDGRYWYALTDGWNIERLRSRLGDASYGRLAYFNYTLRDLLPACTTWGSPAVTLDVPDADVSIRLRDYTRLRSANPSRGDATFELGMATRDHVTVGIYDIAGRRVRVLLDRTLPAGQYRLPWDGRDEGGHVAASGVYFAVTRRTASEERSKLVMLR